MTQLDLYFHCDADALKAFFRSVTGKNISLVITDNSSSMLSIKTHARSVKIRLHRMFLSAGEDVLDEIARYVKDHKIKTPLVRRFIDDNTHQLRGGPFRKVSIRTKGEYHDLSDIYKSVNSEYFEGRVSALITWGVKRSKRLVARRTLGSYSQDNNLIRINPLLDSRSVPKFFVEFIVFHEMLHADVGIGRRGKSRRIHTGEFKKRERQFRHYSRALAWEKKRW